MSIAARKRFPAGSVDAVHTHKALEERPENKEIKVSSVPRISAEQLNIAAPTICSPPTHTFPPRSFELTVTTTEPTVISEMTREKTCIDCSFGAYAGKSQEDERWKNCETWSGGRSQIEEGLTDVY